MSEIKITITADDKSEAELQEVARRIEGVGDSAKKSSAGFEQLARGAQGMTNILERGMGVMTRLDLVQITLQQSADRVAQSQEKYNDAVNRFGAGSAQAIQAQREMTRAQQDAEKANLRAKLSYVLVAGEVVGMAVQLPRAVKGMRDFASTMTVATASAMALNVALTAGIGLIGVGVYEAFFKDVSRGTADASQGLAGMQARLASLKAERAGLSDGTFNPWTARDTAAITSAIKEQEALIAAFVRTGNAGATLEAQTAAITAKEKELTAASGSTKAALLDQLNVTHKKGETTADLIDQLKLSTEEENALRAAGRLTTEGIISQEQATANATKATKEHTKAMAENLEANKKAWAVRAPWSQTHPKGGAGASGAGGSAGGGETTPGWFMAQHPDRFPGGGGDDKNDLSPFGSGAVYKSFGKDGIQRNPSLGQSTNFAAHAGLGGFAGMAAQQMWGQSSLFGGQAGAAALSESQRLSGGVTRNVLKGARAPSKLDAYMEEMQILLARNPGAASSPASQKYLKFLNGQQKFGGYYFGNPSTGSDSMRQQFMMQFGDINVNMHGHASPGVMGRGARRAMGIAAKRMSQRDF